MMSEFKYCPMCGVERIANSQFCQNCNFEFLTGKYEKVIEEDEEITLEKVSQEAFVESNELIKETTLKINTLISKYLNYSLTNQFNESYSKNISIEINEYISGFLNSEVSINSNGNCMESFKDLINDEKYIEAKNVFIQWIVENRSILPGSAINQYLIPHQEIIKNIEKILDLNLDDNEENKNFFELLDVYLNSEKEFLENLLI